MNRIRWDRVGRVALLCVLVAIVGLYVGPARSYWTARGESARKSAEVARLEHEHARLTARRKALTTPATLAAEARKLGYVMPGEKAYVIEDLPKG
ncbi:MAG: septum formation initiator family protein [Solirubrobacterales bacterium]|jgi:cell division protein FtsB|nr:septum formation initiator family protein [Solirubrobacterales bacterium]